MDEPQKTEPGLCDGTSAAAATAPLEDFRDVPAELLYTLLEGTFEYVLVLDADTRIRWSNAAFRRGFPLGIQGALFADLLNQGSRKAFNETMSGDSIIEAELELHHPASGGVKVVSYRFVDLATGLIVGLGIDRSREMEIVSQMSVLIEELENEVNQRIELTRKLEELATTDGLTGLLNRRRFDFLLRQEWKRWERYRSEFALILIDIDRFKRVNDTHGHLVGDEVLKRVADVLGDAVRGEDWVARYGGEEFAVIAIGAHREHARELADRLLVRIRETDMTPPVERVTVSIGVASSNSPGADSPDRLIQAADEALYDAKQRGRDRVVDVGARGPDPG